MEGKVGGERGEGGGRRGEGGRGKGVSVSPGSSGLSLEDLASGFLFVGPSVLPSDCGGMEMKQ